MTVSQAALQARGRSTILHQSNMPVFGAQAPGQQENSRVALDHRGTNSTAAVRYADAGRRAAHSPVDALFGMVYAVEGIGQTDARADCDMLA